MAAQTGRRFSEKSRERIAELHPLLQQVVWGVLHLMDVTVVTGYRDRATQDAAVIAGKSQVNWPHSKHNTLPSQAVDLAPYPINWEDTERFAYLGGLMTALGEHLLEGHGYKIRWGGDWDGDGEVEDEKFRDMGHFELLPI